MKALEELRRQSAWRGAALACALNGFGSPFDFLVARRLASVPTWPMWTSSILGFALLAILFLLRRTLSTRAITIIFLTNALAVAALLWASNTRYALALGGRFHYESCKLGALATALLAPRLWAGAIGVAAFAGGAALHSLLLPAGVRNELYAEPWAALVYGGFGIALLVYSEHRRALEWAMVKAQVEAASMEQLARSAMAIRDLANTPLQTIALAIELFKRDPDPSKHLEQIGRAVRRLHELNSLLGSYELRMRYPGFEESFDARAILSPNGGSSRP